MPNKLLFLTLKIFSATGGIEKISRIAGRALHELCLAEKHELKIYSLYDKQSDADYKYFPSVVFSGFGVQKSRFVIQSIRCGVKSNIVLLSHINLLPVGYLIKKFSPKTKLVLLAHGIEVWESMPAWKKSMLLKCDRLLAVSNFTKNTLEKNNGIKEKCIVLNNCFDPFLPEISKPGKPLSLLKRYELSNADIILLTLTRISVIEKYKGYEKVIKAVKELASDFPRLKYVIVGRYDCEEKERLDKIINESGAAEKVFFTGFIPDDELAEHYSLADVYVMPSRKEGFGISFIEAMFYGIPVIAGNKDGSADALRNGALGLLVDPDKQGEITAAIKKILDDKAAFIPDRNLLLKNFSYTTYKNNLKNILRNL